MKKKKVISKVSDVLVLRTVNAEIITFKKMMDLSGYPDTSTEKDFIALQHELGKVIQKEQKLTIEECRTLSGDTVLGPKACEAFDDLKKWMVSKEPYMKEKAG